MNPPLGGGGQWVHIEKAPGRRDGGWSIPSLSFEVNLKCTPRITNRIICAKMLFGEFVYLVEG